MASQTLRAVEDLRPIATKALTANFADAIAHLPIAITYHGQRRYVLLSVIQYETLITASQAEGVC